MKSVSSRLTKWCKRKNRSEKEEKEECSFINNNNDDNTEMNNTDLSVLYDRKLSIDPKSECERRCSHDGLLNQRITFLESLMADEEKNNYKIPKQLEAKLKEINFTDVEIAEVKQAFRCYDKTKSGVIKRKSFLFVMRHLGQNPTEDEVDDMLNIVDADRNGLITFQEFLELIATISVKLDGTLEALFHALDYGGSGLMKLENLKEILMIGNSGLTEAEIDEVLNYFHADEDGFLAVEEFQSVMKSLPQITEETSDIQTKSTTTPQFYREVSTDSDIFL